MERKIAERAVAGYDNQYTFPKIYIASTLV